MLSKEQEYLYNLIENSNTSFFVTGKAGTGKSHLIKYLIDNTKKKTVLLAPTGVAAVNIGGQTIHSFFKLVPKQIHIPSHEINEIKEGNYTELKKMLRSLDLLIIDEISMVRSDLFDTINKICQFMRGNTKFFGGIQVVMVGDLFQLPPVLRSEDKELFNQYYKNEYFFSVLEPGSSCGFFSLKQVHRQTDDYFKDLLNNIREKKNLPYTLQELNKRRVPHPDIKGLVVIASRKDEVAKYNKDKLDKLKTPLKTYKGMIRGEFTFKELPTLKELELKVGAQVMMLMNDSEKRWVNGTIGTIEKLTDNSIYVNIKDEVYEVAKYTWENIKYQLVDDKPQQVVVGTYTQFPVMLAWAMTIHKSQGQTFDAVEVRMSRAFTHGQTYVALSRCKSYENLYLTNKLNDWDIIVNKDVIQFMNNFK